MYTTRLFRVLGSFFFGAALVCGLLWVLSPRAAARVDLQADPGDLFVFKYTQGEAVQPGGVYAYGIWYGNDLDGTATDVVIVDTLPVSMTYVGDTSGLTPEIDAGGTITWRLGDLPPGARGNIHLGVRALSTTPEGSGVIEDNCVAITTTAALPDENPGNNASCSGALNGAWGDVDLEAGTWGWPGDPTPGQRVRYAVQWCNHGSAHAGPAWLTDTLPLSTTLAGWSVEYAWENYWVEHSDGDGQLVLWAPALPNHRCANLYLDLLVDAGAPLGLELVNSVSIEAPGDADPGNNAGAAEGIVTGGPRTEVAIDKSVHSQVPVPGEWVNYFVQYENAGNTEVHVWVTDTLPAGVTFGYAHWGGGSQPDAEQPLPAPTSVGGALVWDLGALPVGQSRWFHIQADITDTLSVGDVVTNCVQIGAGGAEGAPGNNGDCVPLLLNPSGPNLRVSKEWEWQDEGRSLGYWLTLENRGTTTVSDVWITDTLPLSTTYGGGWDADWDGGRFLSDGEQDGVLTWRLDELQPGEKNQIRYQAHLDDPDARPMWYTNTAEIDTPVGDVVPADNRYTAVVVKGELDRVELWVDAGDRGSMWGAAAAGETITVTTPYTRVTTTTGQPGCDTCWDVPDIDHIYPGETITVTAGREALPVVLYVPDPFTVEVDSRIDVVRGQIGGYGGQLVEVHGEWPGGYQETTADGAGRFAAGYGDIPHGGEGYIRFETIVNYAQTILHREFDSPDLNLNVNYGHDWVEGSYAPGHTVWITVTESDGVTAKGAAALSTGVVPWWDGNTGFSTNWQGWTGAQPDILPNDWVLGETSTGYTASVQVGRVSGWLDVDDDGITGTVDAPWLSDDVDVNCEPWGSDGSADTQFDRVAPDGVDAYDCSWAGEWDVQPGQDVGVFYAAPEGHQVGNAFREPTPRTSLDLQAEGSPAEGGNFRFRIRYANDGEGEAPEVTITSTLEGGMAYLMDTSPFAVTTTTLPGGDEQVVLDVGAVTANSSGELDMFVRITGSAGDPLTHTAQIATRSPFDDSDPGERERTWNGQVQANDTYLNVDKYSWTGDPVPGGEFVWVLNACHWGQTASAQVWLTDTLPLSTTLLSWWGQDPGWTEVFSDGQQLALSYPSLSGGCSEVYLGMRLDADVPVGTGISNTAVISAANDLNPDDNGAESWIWASLPRPNLKLYQEWSHGQKTPGGEIIYEHSIRNEGNVTMDPVWFTQTVPAGTSFSRGGRYTPSGEVSLEPDWVGADAVAWNLGALENGGWNSVNVYLRVDPSTPPGTDLISTAQLGCDPGETTCTDNEVLWRHTVQPDGPNLEVNKDNWRWDGGGALRYELRVKNWGTETLSEVWITDTYPVSTTWNGDWGVNHGPWITLAHDAPSRALVFWLETLEPQETASIEFGVELEGSLHGVSGLWYTNTLSAPVAGDVDAADNHDLAAAFAGPDLFARQWHSGGVPRPGEVVTLTIEFGNRSGWPVDGAWGSALTDTLPAGMTYITSTAPWSPQAAWTPDQQPGGVLRWGWGAPWQESTWTFGLAARITDTALPGDVLVNVVEYAGHDPDDVEWNPADNGSSLPLTVLSPAFELTKRVAGSGVAGTAITYTLVVTNMGNETATGVALRDTLPPNLTYLDSDGAWDGTAVTWTVDSLAPGAGAMGWVWARLPCAGTVTNDAYRVVGSDQGAESEPGQPVSIDVSAPTISAGLDYAVQGGQSTPEVGYEIAFTLTATTDGAAPLNALWDLGEGTSASGPTASTVYTRDGSYRVVVTATGGCGYSATASETLNVQPPLLNARIGQSADLVMVGQEVRFSDDTQVGAAAVSGRAWDFGDGDTAAAASPAHAYAAPGSYTVTLAVTNSYGYTDRAVVVDAVRVITGVTTEIDAAAGGTLVYTDPQGLATTVEVPGAAVTGAITLAYTPVISPENPATDGFAFAGHSFELEAYQGSAHLEGYVFGEPVTVTLRYSDADVEGMDESGLLLTTWEGGAWVDAACGAYDRRPDQNWLAAPICHLSAFALQGERGVWVYLPLAMNGYIP